MTNPYKLLQVALAIFGVVALLLYPLSVVWSSGWAWHAGAPYESQYFTMIVAIYATIGVFLLNAARKPEANLSFIWFVVWSSLVHAGVMAVQSFGGDGDHMGHLLGDVPALLAVAVVLAVLVRAADLRRPAAVGSA
jgi:cytochrome c biogenesis factor